MMRRVALALLLGGCFSDAEPAGDGGSTGAGCPEGSSGCACYGNGTCDGELACTDGYCIDPQCIDGTENCPCLPSGGCDTGLVCSEGAVCKPDPGGTSVGEVGTSSADVGTSGFDTGAGTMLTSMTTSVDTALEVGETDNLCLMMACADNQVCDPFSGQCVDTYPYVRCNPEGLCDESMATCVSGLVPAENICAAQCDPIDPNSCPLVPGLPSPLCHDSDGDGGGVCLLLCDLQGMQSCPVEMVCTMIPNGDQTSFCAWY